MNPQKQNEQNNFNMSVQPVVPETKKHDNSLAIIILAILLVGSLIFGGYELWQNITLREENAKLKNTNDQQKTSSNQILEYEYEDKHIPPTTYKIKLDYSTKELSVDEHRGCSALDCDGADYEKKITLTDDEIEKITTITSETGYNRDSLSPALAALAHGSAVMERKGDVAYDRKTDLDNDGVVTYREFGNSWLDTIINGD